MSQEIQKVPKVIEGGRVWPFYEETGMPVLPRKTRCVGIGHCRAIAKQGYCKPNTRHHLLFDKKAIKSLGHPYDQLVNDDIMSVRMAECRHNFGSKGKRSIALHDKYDRAFVPDRSMVYRAIDELRLLRAMVTTAADIQEQINNGINGFDVYVHDATRERKLHTVGGLFVAATIRFDHLRDQMNEIEVIPDRIVQKTLQGAYNRRAVIREVFAEENLDRVPPQLLEAAAEVQLLSVA